MGETLSVGWGRETDVASFHCAPGSGQGRCVGSTIWMNFRSELPSLSLAGGLSLEYSNHLEANYSPLTEKRLWSETMDWTADLGQQPGKLWEPKFQADNLSQKMSPETPFCCLHRLILCMQSWTQDHPTAPSVILGHLGRPPPSPSCLTLDILLHWIISHGAEKRGLVPTPVSPARTAVRAWLFFSRKTGRTSGELVKNP